MKAAIAAAVLAALLVPSAQGRIDLKFEKMGPEPDVSSVWTGPVVRAFSLGFREVLADLYWLRAVQYYGRQKLVDAPTGYADLRPLLETAAELDPRFEIVYRYGAVFLSEAMPIGAGQPEAGVALLKKGADRNPMNWRLRQDEGLFNSIYLNDPHRASQVLLQAAQIPGSAPWLKPLAAQVLAKGGELEASLQMWTIIRDQSEPGALRENAEAQLGVVRNRMVARALRERITEYRNRTGDTTSTLEELQARGVIGSTLDLAGVPFEFNPADGTLSISKKSPWWRRDSASN
ncbi:MAG: hypothetical protein KA385_15600 [Vicinamibacteria bacterium]|nr:hypothetical protein [Vicinamibacteria bacterium]